MQEKEPLEMGAQRRNTPNMELYFISDDFSSKLKKSNYMRYRM